MNPLAQIVDAIFGRVTRWLAYQWGRGRAEADRKGAVLRELATAVTDAVAESRSIGRGFFDQQTHERKVSEAEARAAALSAEVDDPALQEALRRFAEQARPFAEGHRQARREDLQAAADAVLERIQQIRGR